MPKRLILIAFLIAPGVAAAVAAAWPGLKSRTNAMASSREMLRNIRSESRNDGTCIDKTRMRSLLTQLSLVDAHSPYWLLSPLLGNPDITRKSALAVVDESLRQAVVPDLVCRISQHVYQLSSSPDETNMKEKAFFDPAVLSGSRLVGYLKSIVSLEVNVVRFHRLGIYSSQRDTGQSMRNFYQLEEYAYGSPLPAPVRQTAVTLAPEIADGTYWSGLHIPYGIQRHYADHIRRLSTNLRLRLEQEIDMGPALLARARGSREIANGTPVQASQWLFWIDRSWLRSDASRNPCSAIRSALEEDIGMLISKYGYPDSFREYLDAFDADRCYRPLMARLSGMRLPPYGTVFIRGDDNALQINPQLQGELKRQTG